MQPPWMWLGCMKSLYGLGYIMVVSVLHKITYFLVF